MGFGEAIHTCFAKMVTFQGRASRSEFWWFALFLWLLTFVVAFVLSAFLGDSINSNPADPFANMALLFGPILVGAFVLMLASLSVTIRRLHDSGKTGWWYWIAAIPYVGGLLLLIFMLLPGTDGDNRFGPKPLS